MLYSIYLLHSWHVEVMRHLQRKHFVETRRDSSFCPFLCYISLSLQSECQSHILPHIDSLQFCFTGSVRPVLLVIFRLSGSLCLSPWCAALVSVEIWLALKRQQGDLNWFVLTDYLFFCFFSSSLLSCLVFCCFVCSEWPSPPYPPPRLPFFLLVSIFFC